MFKGLKPTRVIGWMAIALIVGLVWLSGASVAFAQPAPNPVPLLKQVNDSTAPQPMTAAELADLKDPFFQLVLKNHADAVTLPAINQFLKPATQDVFVVDERIVDAEPKPGGTPAIRRSTITVNGTTNQQVLDNNVFLSIRFNSDQFPTGNFIEVMGWDESQGRFNYYEMDRQQSETKPSWKFRGSSKDADILAAADRQGTCMRCHINGGPVMKELLLPWNNWDSFSAKTAYLLKGNSSWPVVKLANSPLNNLKGAEQLETSNIMPTTTRFNQRRINALKNGQTITDARRLLKPLFVTTEFNLNSSSTPSPLHPFSKPTSGAGDDIFVPGSFFLNTTLLGDLGIFPDLFGFSLLSTKDYAHLVTQTKTSLAGKQPGDNNFAWFIPEASFIDSDFVSQLMQQNIVPQAFVAAALAVDLENPVFSRDRAKLWSDKILPATFKFGTQNDLTAQVIKNLQTLNPAAGTPEATFLQLLRSPNPVAALQDRVNQFVNRERQRLDINSGATLKGRSDEWIRLYKLALARREAVLSDPLLKTLDETGGKLLLARGDVNANVSPLPSVTPPKPRPTLRIGSKGNDVVFLQQQLKALGFLNGAIDGDFGPMTRNAVIAFQKNRNLDADGVVGPMTWAAIQA
ncbi:MAG: peptidoglycan-binding protein [Oculatellaceae cyanobacterium Prado106]|jgi:hypothetical protein|nr:peptidoglycan-binding protein [Oculatellaceae cyanobacterium Prado106]